MILLGISVYIEYYAQGLKKKKKARLKAAYQRDKHKTEANVHIVADKWSKKRCKKLQHASVQKKSEIF